MHQVGNQPRLYYDARSTNHKKVSIPVPKHHDIKSCVRVGAPRILHLGTNWRLSQLHTLEPLTRGERDLITQRTGGWVSPKLYGCMNKCRENFLSLTLSNIIDVHRRISRHFWEINVIRIMETASCTKLAYRSRTLVRCHDNSTGRAQLLTVGLEPALLP
jgi:hypothetical protein